MPKVIIEPYIGQSYGGYCEYGGKLIVIVDYSCEKHLAAVLAHEFRHVCQNQLNKYDLTKAKAFTGQGTYEQKITKYFRSQDHELDALLFEFKHAKNETNHWWLKHLVQKGY